MIYTIQSLLFSFNKAGTTHNSPPIAKKENKNISPFVKGKGDLKSTLWKKKLIFTKKHFKTT